jgi:hypothetical protein
VSRVRCRCVFWDVHCSDTGRDLDSWILKKNSTPWNNNIGLCIKFGGSRRHEPLRKRLDLTPLLECQDLIPAVCDHRTRQMIWKCCNCCSCLYYNGEGRALFVGNLRGNSCTVNGGNTAHDAIRQRATP